MSDGTESKVVQNKSEYPFPVPEGRFDQRMDMFSRPYWDEAFIPYKKKPYEGVVYQNRAGYEKLDYAFRNASFSLSRGYDSGDIGKNDRFYSRDGSANKYKEYIETGGQVIKPPEEMSRIVKKAAHFFGADLVGICKVYPNWVYSHEYDRVNKKSVPLELPDGCTNAIVMASAMDYDSIRYSPTASAGIATGLGYSKMAFIANLVATFVKGLGYQAIPSGNDTALSVPMAMAAGLGEWSRMGLLITEEYGPRVRLFKVFTDLPLEPDSYRPIGVVEFCKTCEKCAAQCPSQAIPYGEMTTEGPSISNQSGILKWYVEAEKCYIFWKKNRNDCVTCIRVCPFNKSKGLIHDVARVVIRRTPVFNSLFLRLDDFMGYGKREPASGFWHLDE